MATGPVTVISYTQSETSDSEAVTLVAVSLAIKSIATVRWLPESHPVLDPFAKF